MTFLIRSAKTLLRKRIALTALMVIALHCFFYTNHGFAQTTKPGLDAKSVKALANIKLYYGKRISFRSKLDEVASQYPLTQFLIGYKLGNQNEEFAPFAESFTGPNIPASVRIVKVRVLWLNGKDTTQLFAHDAEVEQTPPEISVSNRTIRIVSRSDRSVRVSFHGISVDYEVPIDADNSIPTMSKSIKAILADVEQEGEVSLDTVQTKLALYEGYRFDNAWKGISNIVLSKGELDKTTGEFRLELDITNLPNLKPTSVIRGTMFVKAAAKIVNRKAGKTARSTSPAIGIPIEIFLGERVVGSELTVSDILGVHPAVLPKFIDEPVRLRFQEYIVSGSQKNAFVAYELDDEATTSFRKMFTPEPERTELVESAFEECTNTQDILKRARKRQPIVQGLIDEGGNVLACEAVKNYCLLLQQLHYISRVIILCEVPQKAGATSSGAVICAVGIVDKPSDKGKITLSNNLFREALAHFPLYTADELGRFLCKAEAKQPKKTLSMQGFPQTSAKTVLEYVGILIKAGKLRDVTAELIAK